MTFIKISKCVDIHIWQVYLKNIFIAYIDLSKDDSNNNASHIDVSDEIFSDLNKIKYYAPEIITDNKIYDHSSK